MGRSTAYTVENTGDVVAPSTGRVHLVSMSDFSDPNTHFLKQLTADANMGAKSLRKNRKGPFKSEKGPSRMMSRSAHVTMRRRHHTIEITIRRGVTDHEIALLLGRLVAHRVSTHESHVFLIDTRRRKIGTLHGIDMEKLKKMIFEALVKRTTVGMHIVDNSTGGALQKPHVYKYDMQDFVRSL